MAYLLVCVTAFVASLLTLFSGFGLGTILLPAFGLFFPIEAAVVMTAAVHLLNNLFEFALLGRHANGRIVARFGVPAMVFAAVGAWLLAVLADLQPIHSYTALGRTASITPVKLVIAALMIAFALLEASGKAEVWRIPPRLLPLGGAISGFFGGLSGHQGALRSAFLLKMNLSKEQYIATGIVIACLVDVVRLGLYALEMRLAPLASSGGLVAAATVSAFLGALLGARLVRKVTIRQIQVLVAVMMLAIAVAMAIGLI